jgi:histidinol-phosphate aminotransferase
VTLAIDSYAGVATLTDSATELNLSWTSDEREFLAQDLTSIVASCLTHDAAADLTRISQYFVKDPYAASILGPAVESFFGTPGLGHDVSCGAGVNALLHALAPIWLKGTVLVSTGVYPDFPHWLSRAGACAISVPYSAPVARWQAELNARSVSCIFVERPSFLGLTWDDPEMFRELCRSASRAGAAVLVDESNANYCDTSFSAVPLTRELDNLIVLRGMSKGYGLGGLRVGICVSSAALTGHIRSAMPPLQASSLSLLIARSVLQAGDLGGSLRSRIAIMKRKATAAVMAAGLNPGQCHGSLPYLLLPDEIGLYQSTPVGSLTIKRHALWMGLDELSYVNRCSVPLRTDRMTTFERLMAAIKR